MQWLPILSYHRVVPTVPADDPYGLCMSFAAFRRQMELLQSRGYRTIGLEAAGRAMASRAPLPPRSFVITFDDGYRDTLEVAVPLLRELDYTATVFMVAGLVGAENRWDAGKSASAPLMDWEELAVLRGAGFTVGSHTFSHADLSRVPLAEARRELAESRVELEQGLGAPVRTFAYPYGRWTPEAKNAVAEAGYSLGCNGTWRREHEQYALARVDARYRVTPMETLARMQAPLDRTRRGLLWALGRGR